MFAIPMPDYTDPMTYIMGIVWIVLVSLAVYTYNRFN